MPGIYCIENIINNKKYIGQAQKLNNRMNMKHRGCIALNGAIEKYGKENFKKYIIEECNLESLDEREIHWIKKLHSHVSEWGYNISWGGNTPMRGRKHTDESKKKQSDAKLGEKSWMFGKHLSEEHKKRIGESGTGDKNGFFGKNHSDENRKKISESKIGKKHSDEFKKKQSEMRIGNKNHNFCKKNKNSSSKYWGVSISSDRLSWIVTLSINGKQKYLGSFKDEIDAAKAYDKYVIENNLDRLLNFPEDKLNNTLDN